MMDHMRVLLEVVHTRLKIVSNMHSYLFSGKQLSNALHCSLLIHNCSSEVLWRNYGTYFPSIVSVYIVRLTGIIN
jgi:hypothetical protein